MFARRRKDPVPRPPPSHSKSEVRPQGLAKPGPAFRLRGALILVPSFQGRLDNPVRAASKSGSWDPFGHPAHEFLISQLDRRLSFSDEPALSTFPPRARSRMPRMCRPELGLSLPGVSESCEYQPRRMVAAWLMVRHRVPHGAQKPKPPVKPKPPAPAPSACAKAAPRPPRPVEPHSGGRSCRGLVADGAVRGPCTRGRASRTAIVTQCEIFHTHNTATGPGGWNRAVCCGKSLASLPPAGPAPKPRRPACSSRATIQTAGLAQDVFFGRHGAAPEDGHDDRADSTLNKRKGAHRNRWLVRRHPGAADARAPRPSDGGGLRQICRDPARPRNRGKAVRSFPLAYSVVDFDGAGEESRSWSWRSPRSRARISRRRCSSRRPGSARAALPRPSLVAAARPPRGARRVGTTPEAGRADPAVGVAPPGDQSGEGVSADTVTSSPQTSATSLRSGPSCALAASDKQQAEARKKECDYVVRADWFADNISAWENRRPRCGAPVPPFTPTNIHEAGVAIEVIPLSATAARTKKLTASAKTGAFTWRSAGGLARFAGKIYFRHDRRAWLGTLHEPVGRRSRRSRSAAAIRPSTRSYFAARQRRPR